MAAGTNVAFNHTALLIGNGKIDFANDAFEIMLASTLPVVGNTLKSQITVTNIHVLNSNLIALTESWATVATDDAKFDAGDITFTNNATTASTVAGFCVYNQSATNPLDAVVCFGRVDTANATITLAVNEKLKFAFNASGIIQLQPA